MNIQIIPALLIIVIITSVTNLLMGSFTPNTDQTIRADNQQIEVDKITTQFLELYEINDRLDSELKLTQQNQEMILEKLNTIISNISGGESTLSKKIQTLDDKSLSRSSPASSPFENMSAESLKVKSQMKEQMRNEEFFAEPIDIEWRTAVHEKLDLLFQGKSLTNNSEIISKNCRSTMCRIEISHSNIDAIGVFSDEFRVNFGWPGSSEISSYDENGQMKTLMYLIR